MALASKTAADWENSLDFSTQEVFFIGLPYNLISLVLRQKYDTFQQKYVDLTT